MGFYKYILVLGIMCFWTVLSAQDFQKISPRLQERMLERGEDQIPVFCLMEDQVDVFSLHQSFRERNLGQQERIAELIPALQEKAAEIQEPLIKKMIRETSLSSDEIRRFWLANAVSFYASSEDIISLSKIDEFRYLDLDAKNYVEEHTSAPAPPALVPGGIEPGLSVINAEPMWALGYTGYGTIAFSADTGIEGFHPAYSNRWIGSYSQPSDGWYEYNNDNAIPNYCGDHGTHTLGTMVGLDHITNDTIGVAFHANWVGAPNLCSNLGTTDNVGAFQWALNPDEDISTVSDMPTVINNSWYDPSQSGMQQCNSVYVPALEALEAAGVAVIFSAGNDGGNGSSSITAPKNINLTPVNSFCVANINGTDPALSINPSSSQGPSVCGGTGSELIKPEVGAPGTSVRSCELNRTYGLKSGTSMAAPHVAGAILLLKEAFPDLLSEDLKYALYNTAVDLGEPGEDNIFGNGLIDVTAAYNYLIDQQNTPATPDHQFDLIGADTDPQLGYCQGEIEMAFYVTNGGDSIITDFEYSLEVLNYDNGLVQAESGTWEGQMGRGEIGQVNLPIASLPQGDFLVKFLPTNPNGQEDPRPLNNALAKMITFDEVPGIELSLNVNDSLSVCGGSRVLLSGSIETDNEYNITWYSDYQGNNPIGQGLQWLTPVIDEPREYYANAILDITGGPEVPNDGNYTSENKLRLTAIKDIFIASVDINAEQGGPTIIQALNTNDEIVRVKNFNLSGPGEHTLQLNFALESGNYKLAILGAKKLLEKTVGVQYPFVAGGEFVITGS
ncbi:MAG: S8 family serine peptidase, partial [Saprospiraceae bacterium]|nr:S8 family serine peptidase [Saprospiraceae bacterium]